MIMYNMIRKWEENKKAHLAISTVMIILSSLLQVYVIQVFMNPCNLISGGFTGIALFINRIGGKLGIDLPVSMLIIALNVPVALFCYKAISKRFVYLSALQFSLTSLLLEVLNFEPLFYDLTINILFGGLLWGFSISLALQAGGSTGGTDFIAQYIGNKIHHSIFEYVFYFNCAMYIAYGAGFGWIYAAYSIIFQYLSTMVINRTYKRYAKVTLEFTTENPDVVVEAFMKATRHGMSVIEARGGFSGKKYYICKSVVAAYEVQGIIDAVRAVAPHALVNVYQSMNFVGNFYQKPIE